MSKGQKTFWYNTFVWLSIPVMIIVAICAILEHQWAYGVMCAACVLALGYLAVYGTIEFFARLSYKYKLLGQVETEEEMEIFLNWWPWLADGQIDVLVIDCEKPEEKAFLEKILPIKIPKIIQKGS